VYKELNKMSERQSEIGIETSPLIKTDPLVSTDFMGQLGVVNIREMNLIITAKTSIEKKLNEIFSLLQASGVINIPHDDFYKLLVHAIDACKCKDETNTRFFSFPGRFTLLERTVKKDSHLKDKER
jgi:hypothetical protein